MTDLNLQHAGWIFLQHVWGIYWAATWGEITLNVYYLHSACLFTTFSSLKKQHEKGLDSQHIEKGREGVKHNERDSDGEAPKGIEG